jgi:hypothetical protein
MDPEIKREISATFVTIVTIQLNFMNRKIITLECLLP